MSDNNIKYLLGIDGGGTKTEFLLADINKNEIRKTVLSSSNPVNIGMESSKLILKQGINNACDGIGLEEISVFAGIAGGGSENIRTSIFEFLTSLGFGAVDNGSDTDTALYTALKGKNGVAVIMGTGIAALNSINGKTHRTGGWGYMIDKGGSGFCYGSDALNCAFSFIDGRGGSELLLNLIEEKMQKPLAESVSEIYSKGPAFVASFAPAVFEAYKKGDKTAESIIDRNSKEAAKIIEAALKNANEGNNSIVIVGGLCRQKDIIGPFIKKHLDGNYEISFSDEPIVNGAVRLAYSLLQR